ncbi:hypothetical protein Q5O24_09415 [Eubacteriaceae bacterium ES3]|nr:hypothetical protein Q5O24_09415 [Eubacteriaceae bacterium ES3]
MMKSINQLIKSYTLSLQNGEIKAAYKGILEFIGKLRVDLIRKYPAANISGIYHGYLDMSYFSVSTEELKESGLKIAIVYLHEKAVFEVWLSARNREIANKFKLLVTKDHEYEIEIFHEETNRDAIIESILLSELDFEDPTLMIAHIELGIEKFFASISSILKS